jgi:multidrug efflux pump subunit AcrA (membrane-fusion protein)
MLCTLDSRDIHLQRVALESQKEQAFRKYREAMASSNRANMKIFREQMNQAEAQLGLIRDQILRTKLTAPFDAVVVSGDLSQSLGSPVQRGQILFQVAPLHDYRLKLQVDERDIGEVKAEQSGSLILNSLPNMKFPFVIEKITPVSSTREGENYFLVEAKLGQASERLRPGMEGFSKVDVGRRKLIWIWTHDLIDWVKLWVWSWWP